MVKDGRTQANEVDAISGATISSLAVVRIINGSNSRWLERLPESGSAPAAEAAPSAAAGPSGSDADATEEPG